MGRCMSGVSGGVRMREYKFRAWDSWWDKMHYFDFTKNEERFSDIDEDIFFRYLETSKLPNRDTPGKKQAAIDDAYKRFIREEMKKLEKLRSEKVEN